MAARSPARADSFAERDAALARALAQEDRDAELARRLAMEEAARPPLAGLASAAPRCCPSGHGLRECIPQYGRHTCDGCGRSPLLAPERLWRCGACDFDLCSRCAGGPSLPPASGLARRASDYGVSADEDEGMLYVPCEIGGLTLEMMVDTGAQTSVISAPLTRQLNLMGFLDSSQQGIATGVGQARILGKLCGVPVKMGHVEFKLSFSVIELQDNLFMLGLDQMRRFKCIVDLERKNLVFGGAGGIEVPFLQDSTRRNRWSSRRDRCSPM